jgi:hypothetical protein
MVLRTENRPLSRTAEDGSKDTHPLSCRTENRPLSRTLSRQNNTNFNKILILLDKFRFFIYNNYVQTVLTISCLFTNA